MEAGNRDKEQGNRSTLRSRNVIVLGHRTSVRLEPQMWRALRDIAAREGCKINDLCTLVQMRKNPNTTLTAAIRVFVMLYYRAGHGNFSAMTRRARVCWESLNAETRELLAN